jgi:hypothetical protein
MVSLDAALPLFDAGDLGKTLHEAAAPELSIDDDRQIVSELLNDEVANGFILRPAPLLFVNFSPAVTNKGVFQYLGPQHAADQVNADGFKIGCATTCHDFRSFHGSNVLPGRYHRRRGKNKSAELAKRTTCAIGLTGLMLCNPMNRNHRRFSPKAKKNGAGVLWRRYRLGHLGANGFTWQYEGVLFAPALLTRRRVVCYFRFRVDGSHLQLSKRKVVCASLNTLPQRVCKKQ